MKLFEKIVGLLYPERCMLCRRILRDSQKYFCRDCRDKLPCYENSECRRDIRYVKLCVAPFQYKEKIRESLHRYKFGGCTAYARIYADFIAKSIDENKISCDIISWVPLSKRRLRRRGYDQAELIAVHLAKGLNIPCRRLLIKTRDNKPQSSLKGREQRRANAGGVYRLAGKEDLTGRRVLLVDDIVTTGATVSSCASVLANAGCVEIYAAAAATRQ